MPHRVVLVQSTPSGAAIRANALRQAGFEVEAFIASEDGPSLFKWLSAAPSAFLIDLDRTPSAGRARGMWLRKRKDTRHVPLIFAGGAPQAAQGVREYLPDATFTEWDDAPVAVAAAVAAPPADPVVPDTMAPYRGSTLARKLNITGRSKVVLMGAPPGFESSIDGLPAGATFSRSARSPGTTVLLFVESLGRLARAQERAAGAVASGGALWVIWPKQASGRGSDLTQAKVRTHLMERHWVDYKIASIDATWTGMVFARRDNTDWFNARRGPLS